ncbi:helix-turn-helix domain-containing protein [Streptomyces sp. NPDC088732]|uniref:helix-turn-helix domain-containing protein n=1 Tax=Streptomyces sp. NPDC088732 TaxID=3365879 RepID=UPI00382CF2A3
MTAGGLPAPEDRERSGRPPRFPPLQTAEVNALACQLPAEPGIPLSRWSCPELAREAVDRGIVEAVSASTVRRWLKRDALKPQQYHSWIFIRDPDFRTKVARIMGLYAGLWQCSGFRALRQPSSDTAASHAEPRDQSVSGVRGSGRDSVSDNGSPSLAARVRRTRSSARVRGRYLGSLPHPQTDNPS